MASAGRSPTTVVCKTVEATRRYSNDDGTIKFPTVSGGGMFVKMDKVILVSAEEYETAITSDFYDSLGISDKPEMLAITNIVADYKVTNKPDDVIENFRFFSYANVYSTYGSRSRYLKKLVNNNAPEYRYEFYPEEEMDTGKMFLSFLYDNKPFAMLIDRTSKEEPLFTSKVSLDTEKLELVSVYDYVQKPTPFRNRSFRVGVLIMTIFFSCGAIGAIVCATFSIVKGEKLKRRKNGK